MTERPLLAVIVSNIIFLFCEEQSGEYCKDPMFKRYLFCCKDLCIYRKKKSSSFSNSPVYFSDGFSKHTLIGVYF